MLKRLGFALEAAGLLYLICIAVTLVKLWRDASIGLVSVVGGLGAPAVAAVLFVGAVMAVPGLVGKARIVVPLNFTLPTVFSAFILATVSLSGGSSITILRMKDLYAASLIWVNPAVLGTSVALQIAAFTALALYDRRSESKPVD